VKGSEFLRRVKKKSLSGRNSSTAGIRNAAPAATARFFFLGDELTVVKDLKKELGLGLLADMCRQLGIRKEDL
jgi:hypothetical protein